MRLLVNIGMQRPHQRHDASCRCRVLPPRCAGMMFVLLCGNAVAE